jgi:hypothetical protein
MEKHRTTIPDQKIRTWDFFIGHLSTKKMADDYGADLLYDIIKNSFPNATCQEFSLFFEAYAQKYKLPKKVCALLAHGGKVDANWLCYDEFTKQHTDVLDFVKTYDGKYAVIYLNVCNDGRTLPQTTKSCIVFGDGKVGCKTVHKHDEQIYRAYPLFQDITLYTVSFDTKQLLL